MPDMTNLAAQHDCLLLDLDGTLYRGAEPTTGAQETLAAIDKPAFFITNNASRRAAAVAAHLRELGFAADSGDVATSAQAAARLLASQLPAGAAVLVVGTDGLAGEISEVGLRPVRKWEEQPAAVVQGYSPYTTWADLAEAALALRAGAVWVAANVDVTLPTERGLLPGNGALVEALRVTSERDPQVAGKPKPLLFTDCAERGGFAAPLVVGDRMNTDIAGANAAGMPSLMVLTGVNTARDAILASEQERPTYIGDDLRALLAPAERLRVCAQPHWAITTDAASLTVTAADSDVDDDGLSIVRAVADAMWKHNGDGEAVRLLAGDDAARAAMSRWALLDDPDPLA